MEVDEPIIFTETTSKNLPWVEKYRPHDLAELVSHQEIIKTSILFYLKCFF